MTSGRVRLLRSPSGRTAVLAPADELDPSSLRTLEDGLSAATAGAAIAVVVDLQSVDVLDAASFGLLLSAHRTLIGAGRDLLVINVGSEVSRTIALLDTDRELRVVTLERLLTPAWLEDGALPIPHERP